MGIGNILAMEVRYDDDELARIEADPDYSGGLDRPRVRAFRKLMNIVRSAANETELYQWKGMRFEKLKGARSHQKSLRNNIQCRVIVEIEKGNGPNNNVLVVKGIEDYHGKKQ